MSAEAERIQAVLNLYRRYEHTELRDWSFQQLRDVVEAVKRQHEKARSA